MHSAFSTLLFVRFVVVGEFLVAFYVDAIQKMLAGLEGKIGSLEDKQDLQMLVYGTYANL